MRNFSDTFKSINIQKGGNVLRIDIENIIDYLVQTYGADRDYLLSLLLRKRK